ncbi:hypothetical protein ACWD4T_51690, partial [Streptomyces umbrinus]
MHNPPGSVSTRVHARRERTHPLDPLSPAEIDAAVAVARADGRLGERTRFWGAVLDEHFAREVMAGRQAAGEVRVGLVAMDHDLPGAWEIDVQLGAEPRCLEWRPVDIRRPGITSAEARAAAQACRANPLFREALARRGIHDVSLTVIDAESIGGFVPEKYKDRRITWGSVWHRVQEDDNAYVRPVQGVIPLIDMATMEVLEVEDHGVVPVSEEPGPLSAGGFGPDREGLKPLEVVQPEGPSFTVDGHQVSWQGWARRSSRTPSCAGPCSTPWCWWCSSPSFPSWSA